MRLFKTDYVKRIYESGWSMISKNFCTRNFRLVVSGSSSFWSVSSSVFRTNVHTHSEETCSSRLTFEFYLCVLLLLTNWLIGLLAYRFRLSVSVQQPQQQQP